MSEAKKGKKLSEDHRQKLSEVRRGSGNSFWGRSHTDESKRKMSEAHRGAKASQETRIRMSEAKKGKKHSEDTRRKIAVANTGKQFSPERRRRISEALRGEKHYMWGKHPKPETIKRMSVARMGAKSAFWRGGISCDRDAWRRGDGKAWLKEIWSRRYCDICGQRVSRSEGTWAAAHHVLGFADRMFRSDTGAGLLLCNGCHKGVHCGTDWYKWMVVDNIHYDEVCGPNRSLFIDGLAAYIGEEL